MNVNDVEETVAWYERVLGMKRREAAAGDGQAARVSLQFGTQKINVRPVSTDRESWFTARNAAAGSEDLCFLTDAAPGDVVAHLQACRVAVELGPVRKDGARGSMTSVYCRDPDGNLIEISSYS